MNQLFTRLLASLLFLLIASGMAIAQSTVEGNVKDSNGESLIGVTILVKGTAVGTTSDIDGNFKINVPADASTLIVSYTGFADQEVDIASGNFDVVMSQESAILDEVVITGLASNVKRSNLANSVASIDAEALTGMTVQGTMDGALYGKFKGAEIRSNSGAPGGGMGVKLRGVTSIFGDQQPLYIIDGIYVDNSSISLGNNIVSAAGGGGNTSNQDDASNRIADIDPEDIANIEILKGASAAAIYGSRAAGGVVIITTKKGKSGKTGITFSQALGFTSPTKLLGNREWNADKIGSVFPGSAPDYISQDSIAFLQNGLTDYESELYDNVGVLSTSRLEVSGGNAKTTFFIGGTYKNDEGIVKNTGYEKFSLRANIGHRFNDWLKIDFTNNYINSQSDRGFFNNSNDNTTIGYAQAFTRPWYDLFPDESGTYPSSPAGSNILETVALVTNRENVNRYLAGATVTARLYTNDRNNLKFVVRGGLDAYALRSTGLFPQNLSYYRSETTLGGVAISGSTISKNTNIAALLVYDYYAANNLSFTTQLGVTQEDFDRNTVISTGIGLNGSQTSIDQSASQQSTQRRLLQQDKGIFVQEEVNWDDKIIGTLGVRADKSSNNGDVNKIYYYPKANLAFNIANFDFWSSESVNQFKLRAAYGQSGRFPVYEAKFNRLDATSIGGKGGWVTNIRRGNPDIGPEKQSEIEFGLDLGILKNRISFDATYYIKEIDDLLLRAQVPTSSGYTSKWINGGALENQGIELGLAINVVNQPDITWNTGFSFWTNDSEITRLDVDAFNEGGFAASLGQYRIQEGQSATQIVGTFNPADCVNDDCSDLDPDGDGFRVYGDAEADFNLSWTNTVAYKGLELSFLWHWKAGGEGINLSTLLYDLGNLTWDYDDTTLDPDGQIPNGDYRKTVWDAGDAGPWIEDNSYIRLREIGLYYNLPSSLFNDKADFKIGVSGRNLVNIFDYNSYDPEVSNFGGNVLASSVEVTPFPAAKQFNFHIKASF